MADTDKVRAAHDRVVQAIQQLENIDDELVFEQVESIHATLQDMAYDLGIVRGLIHVQRGDIPDSFLKDN